MKRSVLFTMCWAGAFGLSLAAYGQHATGGAAVVPRVPMAPATAVPSTPTIPSVPGTPPVFPRSPAVGGLARPTVPVPTPATPVVPDTGVTGGPVVGEGGTAGARGTPSGSTTGVTGGTPVPAVIVPGAGGPSAAPVPELAPGTVTVPDTGVTGGSLGTTSASPTGSPVTPAGTPVPGGTTGTATGVTTGPGAAVTGGIVGTPTDLQLAQEIRTALLTGNPAIVGASAIPPSVLSQVQVVPSGGVVTLQGTVPSVAAMDLVVNRVQQINGVSGVVNNLQVNPVPVASTPIAGATAPVVGNNFPSVVPVPTTPGNVRFAQQIRAQLLASNAVRARTPANPAMPPAALSHMQVLANNGVVTLRGTVMNAAERQMLINEMGRMNGVHTVVDGLAINPTPGR